MVAVVALARAGPVRVAAARVRLNAITASTSQAALAVNARGQVRQGGVLQVGVDLLDDRVPAVGLVRGDGVGTSGSVVVKKAWNRQVSNSVLLAVAAVRG